MQRRWFTAREAAGYLGVSVATLHACVYAGLLGFRRAPADGSVFYSREGLDAVIVESLS